MFFNSVATQSSLYIPTPQERNGNKINLLFIIRMHVCHSELKCFYKVRHNSGILGTEAPECFKQKFCGIREPVGGVCVVCYRTNELRALDGCERLGGLLLGEGERQSFHSLHHCRS